MKGVWRAGLVVVVLATAWSAREARAALKASAPRRVISLDGAWQVEQGSKDRVPDAFTHTVPVPGLVDMAKPAFADVGRKSAQREMFWYRRTFSIEGVVPAVAILKIHKARYGSKIYLNGQFVAEHLPCFTPAYLDVRKFLRGDGQPNELVIGVGADRESVPADVPSGWDFEKYLYIPGIYDSVELILSGTPYIVNVQTVPDPAAKTVRVVAELDCEGAAGPVELRAEVAEAVSGKVVATHSAKVASLSATGPLTPAPSPARGEGRKADFTLAIPDGRTWSPEDPFLYELRLSTSADAARVRFGLRSFRFDAATKRAVLNGRPYIMRGTNVCIYRFFEDAERGDKPWRAQWVRRLHEQFKTMHWDSIRYCIGFPPEAWYDIADELGFLIQDEFPIWLLGKAPEDPKAEKIIPQYVDWMRERWNHPCVVIWDAQNESQTAETGKALMAVRHLDLSNRPWENGWAEPQTSADCVESHPYLFSRGWDGKGKGIFRLSELAQTSGVPRLRKEQQAIGVPIIINEYCWLWLNRDGTPTCIDAKVYEGLLGTNSTTAARRMIHARYVAALTEFWRCHREAAGVLHFCGLGYSRSGDKPRPEGGATSDHFVDLEKLTFEPLIAEYVGEAFNPLGLMLNYWAEEAAAGSREKMEVYVINDREEEWSGEVRLRVLRDGQSQAEWSQPCRVEGLGRTILTFPAVFPEAGGDYLLQSELTDPSGKAIRSLRDVKVK